MVLQRVMPLIVLGIIVLIIAAVVIFLIWHRRVTMKDVLVDEYMNSDGPCGEVNRLNGWICERWEGHPNNHWQTIKGERYDWRDEG